MTSASSYGSAEAGSATSSAAYPYFTSPGADLYTAGTAAGYNSSSAVFSSKTLQPTRPRTKSRANAGKRSGCLGVNGDILSKELGNLDSLQKCVNAYYFCSLEIVSILNVQIGGGFYFIFLLKRAFDGIY